MKQIIVLLIIGLAMLGYGIYGCVDLLNKYGGPKQIIIETGKEIKDIKRQINEGE